MSAQIASATDALSTDKPSILKQTPLHALHVARGGKMVPFAGYDMPVQYASGVLKEHLHTRAAAGLFDVSHMGQLTLRAKSGKLEDAALALERLVPMDILALAPGRVLVRIAPRRLPLRLHVLPQSRSAPTVARVSGHLAELRGRDLVLEALTATGWHRIGSVRADRQGSFATSFAIVHAGQFALRARAPALAGAARARAPTTRPAARPMVFRIVIVTS